MEYILQASEMTESSSWLFSVQFCIRFNALCPSFDTLRGKEMTIAVNKVCEKHTIVQFQSPAHIVQQRHNLSYVVGMSIFRSLKCYVTFYI